MIDDGTEVFDAEERQDGMISRSILGWDGEF